MADNFQDFIELTVGVSVKIASATIVPPEPPKVAAALKEKSLQLIEQWNSLYGELYKKIYIGYKFLKDILNVKLPSVMEVEQKREEERVHNETIKLLLAKYQQATLQMDQVWFNARLIVKEMEICFEILVPTIATAWDKDHQANISNSSEPTKKVRPEVGIIEAMIAASSSSSSTSASTNNQNGTSSQVNIKQEEGAHSLVEHEQQEKLMPDEDNSAAPPLTIPSTSSGGEYRVAHYAQEEEEEQAPLSPVYHEEIDADPSALRDDTANGNDGEEWVSEQLDDPYNFQSIVNEAGLGAANYQITIELNSCFSQIKNAQNQEIVQMLQEELMELTQKYEPILKNWLLLFSEINAHLKELLPTDKQQTQYHKNLNRLMELNNKIAVCKQKCQELNIQMKPKSSIFHNYSLSDEIASIVKSTNSKKRKIQQANDTQVSPSNSQQKSKIGKSARKAKRAKSNIDY